MLSFLGKEETASDEYLVSTLYAPHVPLLKVTTRHACHLKALRHHVAAAAKLLQPRRSRARPPRLPPDQQHSRVPRHEALVRGWAYVDDAKAHCRLCMLQ